MTDSERISLSGLAAGTYIVRVIGYNGATSPSYSLTIKPPAVITLTPPAGLTNNTPTQTSVTISWQAVSGATSYDVWYKKTTDSDWTQATATSASHALSGLSANTTYSVIVRTKNATQVSGWTKPITFTTAAPEAMVPVAPANLSVKSGSLTSTGVTLQWSAQTGLTGYTLQYKLSSDSTWTDYSTTVAASATEIAVTGLTTGMKYDFQLIAKNSVGNSTPTQISGIETVGLGTNYAVLYSGGGSAGDNHVHYYNAIKDLYNVLITSYGLSRESIYVIYADGTSPGIDRPDGQNSDMTFAAGSTIMSATGANLTSVFTTLGTKMGANDHLLFFTSDHGGGGVNQSGWQGEEVLTGWNTSITDVQVAQCVDKVRNGYITLVFGQCFSGGILDNIINPTTGEKTPQMTTNAHIYGMVAANHYEVSWAYTQYFRNSSFESAFINAIDPNRDGQKSLTNEAFAYALAKTPFVEYSNNQIVSYSNNGGTYVITSDSQGYNKYQHPWGAGEIFSIFVSSSSNSYTSNTIQMDGWNDSLIITSNTTSTRDSLELLAENDIYINFAYSNPLRLSTSALVSVSGGSLAEMKTYTLDSSQMTEITTGDGQLTTNLRLGTLGAGTYTMEVELFVGTELVVFSRVFEVVAISADLEDTLQSSKSATFVGNLFEQTTLIGDGKNGGKDVDFYQFAIAAADIGKTFVFNSITPAGSTLPMDTYLRLFNAAGVEVACSTLSSFNGSTLAYTIADTGLYYLAVSSLTNTTFNPLVANSGTEGHIGEHRITGYLSETKADLTLNYDYSWIDNVVISKTSNGRITDEHLTVDDTLYVNYKFLNSGYMASGDVINRIMITGPGGYSHSQEFTASAVLAGAFSALLTNFDWGKLAAGTYTITITLDVNNTLAELNESNNTADWEFIILQQQITLDSPTLNTVTATSSSVISVTWTVTPHASGYTVEYATNAAFTAGVGSQDFGAGAVSGTLTGLTANTVYYVRIIATGTGNYSHSEYSAPQSATTQKIQLSAPTLNQPTASGTTVSASWSSVSNASSYLLEYKLSAASTWTQLPVSGTSTTFTGTAGSTYDVRVTAVGTGSYSNSDSSPSQSVAIPATKLTAPTLGAVTGTSTSQIVVNWTAVSNATGYTIQFGKSRTSGLKNPLAAAGAQVAMAVLGGGNEGANGTGITLDNDAQSVIATLEGGNSEPETSSLSVISLPLVATLPPFNVIVGNFAPSTAAKFTVDWISESRIQSEEFYRRQFFEELAMESESVEISAEWLTLEAMLL